MRHRSWVAGSVSMSSKVWMKAWRTLGKRFSGGAASRGAGASSQNKMRCQKEQGVCRSEGGWTSTRKAELDNKVDGRADRDGRADFDGPADCDGRAACDRLLGLSCCVDMMAVISDTIVAN